MPTHSPDALPWSHPVPVSDLNARKTTRITLEPNAPARAALARDLGLDGLKKLRFAVELTPRGKHDWALAAQLGATVTQPCVISAAPVTTRIDEPVRRFYMAGYAEPEVESGEEVEMPDDDTIEPLPGVIDLGAVMAEALALALPLYPRADGAALAQSSFAEPGVDPLSDEDSKPFAALKALRDKMEDD